VKAVPFHYRRPLVAVAAALGLGIWAGVRFEYVPWLCLAGLALCCLAVFLLRRMGKRMVAGGMGAFLFLGMLLAGHAAHPSLPPRDVYLVSGIVAEDMTLRDDGTAAGYLIDVHIQGEAGSYTLRRVYWTYVYDSEIGFLPLDGQRVSFTGTVYPPSGQTNPYGFDFRMFLLQKGVSVGISGAKEPQVLDHPGRGLSSFLFQTRKYLTERTKVIFGDGFALPAALLLGERDHLPQETQDSFSAAGVAHVLAVSGLHVGLLAGIIQWLLRERMSPGKRLAVLGAFLLFYCSLLNFSAPVVRASLLLMAAGMRRLVRRAPDPLTILSAAFVLILLFRPLDLFSASFQLSFGAVAGIVMLKPQLEKWLQKLRPAAVRDGIGVTLSATAGAALPTIQIFHHFSLVGLVINPLICGIFTVILPLYALALAVGCIYLEAGVALALPLNKVAEWIIGAIAWAGKLPFASVNVPFLPWYALLAIVLCLLLLTRYILLSGKKKAAIGLCALAASFALWQGTVCRDVQYIQFDMGRADAAMILDGEETVLIDAGEYGGDLADYLLSTGRQADHVLITHLHIDHCMGLRELMEADIPIGRIILPEGALAQQVDEGCVELIYALEERGVPILFWAAGDQMQTARTRIQATWPIRGTVRAGYDSNRYPMALVCDLDGVELLSASDIAGEYERYAASDVDILKVSHHGSKYSTKDLFLDLTTPSAALVTGTGRSDTHPHPDTLQRLESRGISVFNTGEWGAITIRIHEGQAQLIPYLSGSDGI